MQSCCKLCIGTGTGGLRWKTKCFDSSQKPIFMIVLYGFIEQWYTTKMIYGSHHNVYKVGER